MKPGPDADDAIRPHVFDGIQEFDKRMPNWWLFTFFGGIAFGVAYWGYYHTFDAGVDPGPAVEARLKANAEIAARNAKDLTDDVLWKLSRDANYVKAGEATYGISCAACHQPDLTGKIGPNLKDQDWVHGGKPMEILATITKGVPEKGMMTWGPILGQQKIAEVTAFILSHHQQGEPVRIVPSTPPGQTPPAP